MRRMSTLTLSGIILLGRAVDLADAAGADRSDDFIRAETSAWSEGQTADLGREGRGHSTLTTTRCLPSSA